ncbi:hypothetical protein ABZ930_36570 [Streptomyces sp. NPDC046716]|uniref:hypothetical protein n=1 Tax=Streptomyces sp. NPDC046716 TaxID=3157093 RepID=UPI0033F1629C
MSDCSICWLRRRTRCPRDDSSEAEGAYEEDEPSDEPESADADFEDEDDYSDESDSEERFEDDEHESERYEDEEADERYDEEPEADEEEPAPACRERGPPMTPRAVLPCVPSDSGAGIAVPGTRNSRGHAPVRHHHGRGYPGVGPRYSGPAGTHR